mgnify:CR=1 FL=1
MLDGLRQFLAEAKAKRALKRASSIISKLKYEIVDEDGGSYALVFNLNEGAPALFVADPTPLGSRIEATIVMPADLANLKLVSDIAMVACQNRCSASGLLHCGQQRVKIDLVFSLGERFNKRDIAVGLSYLNKVLAEISEILLARRAQVKSFMFDLTAFDKDRIPFFDPGLIGERKVFMYGDEWGQYIAEAANRNSVGGYTAVEVDHDLDVVCACRDFEQANDCNLVDVGDLVMMELAKHRSSKLEPVDKAKVQ